MRLRWIGVIVLFFTLCVEVSAQTSTIKAKQIWADFFTFYRINPKFRLYGQIGYRNLISSGRWQQYMIRPCLDYSINQSVGLHGGILSSYTFSDEDFSILEVRPWQGVLAKWPKFGRVHFQHFFRVEERFFFFEDEHRPFTVRLRLQTGVKIPLNNSTITDKTWFIRPYVEFFDDVGTQNTILFSTITRFNFTLGYKFNQKWLGELVFMQHRARETRAEDFEFRDYVFRVVARYFILNNHSSNGESFD